jgi:Metal-sensitive transcriptional repressor
VTVRPGDGYMPIGDQRGHAPGRDDYLARLRKIEGQVRGLQKMIGAGT